MRIHTVYFFRTFFHIPITDPVENFFTPVPRLPGIPVLNHQIQRNPLLAVSLHDFNQFTGRIILFFGLHITIGPFGQKLCLTGQITVIMNYAIHASASKKISVNLVHGVQKQIRLFCLLFLFIGDFIMKHHQRTAVHQYAVAFIRYKQRHRYTHIMLIKKLIMPSVIINSLFCLPQTVNAFSVFPSEKNSAPVSLSVFHFFQILDKISFAVYGFHTMDNRFFITCRIMKHIGFRQFAAHFRRPCPAVPMLPGNRAGFRHNFSLHPGRHTESIS